MADRNKAVGTLLRKLRQQRKLTLKQAAARLNTSAPVLSRKERGADEVERLDIRLAITGYCLTPWEAYALWTEAGFIPEPMQPPARTYNLRDFAETLLLNLPFPAFIQDILGYVVAWNEGIEAIWLPSQTESPRLHIIDELFTARVRVYLGEHWDAYILRALKVFYHKTLSISNDPTFRELLAYLSRRHPDVFVAKWNLAQTTTEGPLEPPAIEMGSTIVPHASPYGLIDYLVMQSAFQFPPEYELIMYVPFGKENQERYEQFKATMGPNRLYFQP